jgi:hypothetical protein
MSTRATEATTHKIPRVFISGQKRGVFGLIKRELKGRSAIEPLIGHMKTDGHLGRCYLKGRHVLSRLGLSCEHHSALPRAGAPNCAGRETVLWAWLMRRDVAYHSNFSILRTQTCVSRVRIPVGPQ